MQPGGGLVYITGPMGSGKSYKGLRVIARAMMASKYVITNVVLREDFAHRLARHTPQCWVMPWTFKKRIALYKSLYIYEEDLQEAIRYQPHSGKKEGRAVFVWDEAHNEVGNRTWMDQNRELMNKWVTQLRKLGYLGYVISQHADNTDAAWRRVANYEVRMRNQRELIRIMGIRVSPIPFFLAVWGSTNTKKLNRSDAKPIHVERYFLGWEKKLYNTLGLFDNLTNELEEFASIIRLPKPGEWTGKTQEMIDDTAHRLMREQLAATENEARRMALIGFAAQELGSNKPDKLTVIPGPSLAPHPSAEAATMGFPEMATPDGLPESEVRNAS